MTRKIPRNTVTRKTLKTNDSVIRKVWKGVEEYMRNSSLHGLKYVGDGSITYIERCFWLIAFISAIFGAAYFISSIYTKYDMNPVIVTMNPLPTPVNEIPFPAITICSLNAVSRRAAQDILENGNSTDKDLLNDLCTYDDNITINDFQEDNGSWDDVSNFMSKISHPCTKMLRVCRWNTTIINCDSIFRPVLTDEGMCCTFNQLPFGHIIRNPRHNHTPDEGNDYLKQFPTDDWNPERGYAADAPDDVYPFRSPGPGANLGLSVTLDADIEDYYCTPSSSAGFKFLLHNPAELSIISYHGYMLPPGNEVRIIFKPVIYDATPDLKQMDIEKRHCYFVDDRPLSYYRVYTTVNCMMECLTNITLQRCGCIPYYLPNSSRTDVCTKAEQDCSDNIREMIEIKGLSLEQEKACNCLPACFQLSYESSMSYGRLLDSVRSKSNLAVNESLEYIQKNILILRVYFVSTLFTKFTKSNLYGFSEFLSNTGGILGLFLGFSALSLVEILYYLTLRLLCNSIRNKKRKSCNKRIVFVKEKRNERF